MKVLEAVTASFTRTFIVIDALDECEAARKASRGFLPQLFNLQSATKLNIFATSRPIEEIINFFGESPRLEIRAHDEDVKIFVNHELSLNSVFSNDDTLRDNTVKKIVEIVDGM